jgi:hypothetical protein
MMCPICEKVTEYPVMGVQTCEVCKANAEIERKAFYRDLTYPINYTSPLLYMRKQDAKLQIPLR